MILKTIVEAIFKLLLILNIFDFLDWGRLKSKYYTHLSYNILQW